MSGRVMVYGASGFSGQAVAERLIATGIDTVASGRNAHSVRAFAQRVGAPFRVFEVADSAKLADGLDGIDVLLNAAGPFDQTSKTLIEACVETKVHYLDLAGEWPVFALAERHGPAAAAAGVMLMPGVGFSVVASDCLLARAGVAIPDAVTLRLALSALTVTSRGTLRSAIGLTASSAKIRRNGRVVDVRLADLQRRFNFGAGDRNCVAVSAPDIITGARTTGVANIECYIEASTAWRVAYRLGGLAVGVVGRARLVEAMEPLTSSWPSHPTPAARRMARNAVVVEAIDPWRRTSYFGLMTLDGYTVSALTAAAISQRVLAGEFTPGFHTPAGQYGPAFIDTLDCAWPYDATPLQS